MDYDRDGKLDFVSGSYDPGEVFLFRALGKGGFQLGAMLYDEQGVPLVHHPIEWQKHEALRKQQDADYEEMMAAEVASYGSFPMPVDWDGDGGLDLLIGSLGGMVFLRQGVPGDKKADRRADKKAKSAWGPFAAASIALDAGGARLRVHSHADPFAADWDGDGRWDLVVGAGDGSVGWYRNEGTAKTPSFGPRQDLVDAKSKTDRVERQVGSDGVPLPGTRAQICVADYDGDGRVDLLMGDYARGGAAKGATSYVWLYRRSGPITQR